MDAAGLFGDDVFFTLCHLDLAPRNIMADIDRTSNALRITGVLDWDSAVFAPNFMNCEPPSWIWAWPDDDDESESDDFEDIHANDEPATPEDQELKRKFEEVMGKDMVKFFHMPQYRLARSLFRLAMSGMRGNNPYDRADRLIQEWDTLQGKPPPADYDFDQSEGGSYHSDADFDQIEGQPYHSFSGSDGADDGQYHSDQVEDEASHAPTDRLEDGPDHASTDDVEDEPFHP